ncbi:NAD-dependent DNA ligase LigA [Anaerocolumna aminovalerica]|uniref:NAD-dependent DNA ligase LigA n=1 Tax=Anaerocolumna aminovalerica TaxID=1527 RepID=UPI001C0EFF1D|nr:NAD-dependent DNA ligase LigA [Anaerocolumna aminovalerica]MBU5331710.1 NAD-dependent DNA ligase LigA [Anaerocolumna aminovalerica]
MVDVQKIKKLVDKLNLASKAYYQEDKEIISNYEYDALYDRLVELEKETGIVLSNSPTRTVGYEVISKLQKVKHDTPMLSLDKTKDVLTLKSWLGNKKGLLSWKLDGLTVVLYYKNGKLDKAVTRGNGEIGELITNNAKVFKNIPITISYTRDLVLRGEAVIKYSDFEKINDEIEDVDAKYKNPRNLCSGSVRQLNNEITAKRIVHFFAFGLVSVDGDVDFYNSRLKQLEWLTSLGFDTVESKSVIEDNLEDTVKWFSQEIINSNVPSDGLVLIYDDINYGISLGRTSKFPKDSIAFKWNDEVRETNLREIEWNTSRTGLINPIAVFNPVELEGTIVSRASIHNISIMESLELGIGDTIQVYKANMIIPQISENLTRSGNSSIPKSCPVCGYTTKIHNENNTKTLYCENPDCLAKKIKSFTHFVGRDAMNIEGLSEATIEKLITKGLIHELVDLFYVEKYKDIITNMEGFGEKSYHNLVKSINKARHVSLAKFLYSLGILNIGLSNAKLISKEFNHDFDKIRKADKEKLLSIPGIGDVIADSFIEFFEDKRNQNIVDDLLKVIIFERQETSNESQILADKTFVITGSVEHFTNRNEVKEVIEQNGGKVTGSVTAKTDYLINNDIQSNSSKNKKAKELGIQIITEEEFIKMLNC